MADASAKRMRYDQIREHVQNHFRAMLDRFREQVAANGPPDARQMAILQSSQALASQPLHGEWDVGPDTIGREAVARFLELRGLPQPEDEPQLDRVQAELRRGYRDYLEAKAAHLALQDHYRFDGASERATTSFQHAEVEGSQEPATTLLDLCDRHAAEKTG